LRAKSVELFGFIPHAEGTSCTVESPLQRCSFAQIIFIFREL
jgi:hypothetical protein